MTELPWPFAMVIMGVIAIIMAVVGVVAVDVIKGVVAALVVTHLGTGALALFVLDADTNAWQRKAICITVVIFALVEIIALAALAATDFFGKS